MFAESMLETSWSYRTRRSWMTLTSFGLQAVVVGLLLMIPLLQTAGLPAVHTVSTPLSLGRPDPGPAPRPEGQRTRGVQIIPFAGRIMAPGPVPSGIPKGGENETPAIEGGGDRIGDDSINNVGSHRPSRLWRRKPTKGSEERSRTC